MTGSAIHSRLNALRMRMREEGITLYMISRMDFHMSEDPADYFGAIEYMSGFTGTNAMMIISDTSAHLWTDGRYTIQAAEELEGTGIQLHISSDTDDEIRTLPRFFSAGAEAFLDALIEDGFEGEGFDAESIKTVIGCDGRTFPFQVIDDIIENLGLAFDSGAVTIDARLDLVGDIWSGRPELPANKVEVLDLKYAGETVESKLERVRRSLNELGPGTGAVITTLDDICWLFNIRGHDGGYSLTALAYAYVNGEDAYLFIDPVKLTGKVRAHLSSAGVTVKGYDEFYGFLEEAPDSLIILDPRRNNAAVVITVADNHNVAMINHEAIVSDLKAVKNDTERRNAIKVQMTDAVVMMKFIKWIKENVGKVEMTEISAGRYLDLLRKEAGAISPSFETICAYGPHAASCHYIATEATDVPIEPHGFLLVDSGGHYYGGTTDVTRTIPLGPLTDEMKRDYTLAVVAMLSLADLVFPQGLMDDQLDSVARAPLWKYGIDFDHSTGHGVGSMLDVHEGPQSFSWLKSSPPVTMKAGMITTDEPGVYREGRYGVRHENELLCIEHKDIPGYLRFVYLTMVPIDTAAIDKRYMTKEQLQLLNKYNEYVYLMMHGFVDDDLREWLRKETQPI